ncbi:nephrocystin-3-like [Dendronephthya gigantea]|uniref:nephrocystin-3-like n=1 Tax=Dendronephthya gigantea TaxID=151771 RepID=UPI00106D1052|nr:nephrocystin-3-like [Dendronephthya gigantea]
MAEAFSVTGEAFRATASVTGRKIVITIGTDNVEVAKEVCKTVTKLGLGLGALYAGYSLLKPLIDAAVTKALGGKRDDQDARDIRPGCLHVELHCFTDERFLEVLADYESGRMKERLQEEFSLVGIKVEGLKVKIDNMEEVKVTKKAIEKRCIDEKGFSFRKENVEICATESGLWAGEYAERRKYPAKTAYDSSGIGILPPQIKDYKSALDLIGTRLYGKPSDQNLSGFESTHPDVSDFGQALESTEKDFQVKLKLIGDDPAATADSYHNIGISRHEMKDYKSALWLQRKALEIRLKLYGEDHPYMAQSFREIGNTQYEMKDYKSALESHQRAYEINLNLHREYHPETAESCDTIGILQHELKNYKLALEWKQKALNIRLKLYGEDHSHVAKSYNNIGITQHALKDYKSALSSHQNALQIRFKLHGEDHPDTAQSYHGIGIIQQELRDFNGVP